MMGVPINGPDIVFWDNTSVLSGESVPEYKLSKKYLGICYHSVREASISSIWKVEFVKGTHKIANILTKIISVTDNDKKIKEWI